MKLTKEQKNKLGEKWMTESFDTPWTTPEWWINQIEQLEDTNSQVCIHSEKDVYKEEICLSCGGTGIYKHETPEDPKLYTTYTGDVEVENKYSAQERQEKGCEHLYGYYKLDENDVPKCKICDKPKPERIEELQLGEPMSMNSSMIEEKINQIIKSVNKLNNN